MENYPSVVIIGLIGTGKTTLLNKICDSKEKTKAGGFSVTRNIFLKGSAYGKGFKIADTPGFGSDQEPLIHVYSIYSAIIEGPLNKILITIRFERYGEMIKQIKQILYWLDRFKHLICIVITHWDLSDDPIQDEEGLKKNVIQKCGLKDYILSGKNISGETICDIIDNMISNSKQEKINITISELLSCYNLENNENFTSEIEKECRQFITNFKQICDVSQKFIEKQDITNKEMPELMHSIILAIKKQGNDMIEEFQNSRGQTWDIILKNTDNMELAYFLPIHLKKKIMDYINRIVLLAQQKMKLSQYHFYNNIKQCPNCGIIWLKVSGCDSQVKCGSYPIYDKQEFKPQLPKYSINFQNNEVNCQTNQQTERKSKWFYNPFNILNWSLKGCGFKADWDKWNVLSQDLIAELQNQGYSEILSLSDEVEQKLKSEQFWNTTQQIQNKVQEEKNVDLSNLNRNQQQ